MINFISRHFFTQIDNNFRIIPISKRKIKDICPIYIRYRQSANVESCTKEVKKYLNAEFSRKTDYILAAAYGEKIVGFLHYGKEFSTLRPAYRFVLKAMFIEPEYRGNGIAKKLIQSVQDHAGNCEIRVKARLTNPASPNLYRKMGFVVDAEYAHMVYQSTLSR